MKIIGNGNTLSIQTDAGTTLVDFKPNVVSLNGVFWENNQTVSTSYTIAANKNAISAGPITIADGITVTVPDGSEWAIV
jgi:hypothetical protein